jgi:hypothetical protein
LDGSNSGLFDVIGRIEIGFADAQANNVRTGGA